MPSIFYRRASITETRKKLALNQLVLAARAHGWWTLCDIIYPFVGGSKHGHLEEPESQYRLTSPGRTVTHTPTELPGTARLVTGIPVMSEHGRGRDDGQSAHLLVYCGTAVPVMMWAGRGYPGGNGKRLGLYKSSPYW